MQDRILQIRKIGFQTELVTKDGFEHKKKVVNFFLVDGQSIYYKINKKIYSRYIKDPSRPKYPMYLWLTDNQNFISYIYVYLEQKQMSMEVIESDESY